MYVLIMNENSFNCAKIGQFIEVGYSLVFFHLYKPHQKIAITTSIY